MKNHSRHLYAPICVIFAPNSVDVARYASFIWHKSHTNCDAHLTESIFQTRSREFPSIIRDKAEELIDILINPYENEMGCILDLSEIYLEARINVHFNRDVTPSSNLSIFIHDDGYLELEQNIQITCQDILYEPSKSLLDIASKIWYTICDFLTNEVTGL